MRLTIVGLFILASACGGSSSGTSSTTSAGVTSGGTTGATTTGGTTGGSSGLSPGSPCTANPQCTSDQCGIDGTGHCCSTLCSNSDATCGATACDDTGACTYPAGTSCGTPSCVGGMLTAPACNASGACGAGTPTACPGNLSCADATSCRTSCTQSSDCAIGFWCSGSSCIAAQGAGSACTQNGSCSSGICGIAGSGNCCTAACNTTDLACGASACDATGACTYPPNTTACGASCTGHTLTTGTCNGTGTCTTASPTACPDNLNCADATTCLTSCTTGTDCTSGFWCSSGTCQPLLADGANCAQNQACTSGVCGTSGTGACCTTACSTADATCGASSCDNTGACIYPTPTTICGPQTCSGGVLTAGACNGNGLCLAGVPTACPNNLACNAAGTGCIATCTANSDCAGSDANFCDTPSGVCCVALANPDTLTADNAAGSDIGCCGYGAAAPCQTLTRAMQLVNETNGLNPNTLITISASVNGASDWNNETYPVSLDWGVTVSSSGLYFTDPNGNAELFDVTLGSGETAGNVVTFKGDTSTFFTTPTILGSDSLGTVTTDPVVIQIEANATLAVSAIDMYEATGAVGIAVGTAASPGTATLQITDMGTLRLGGPLPSGYGLSSYQGTGVLCYGAMNDANYTGFYSYSVRGRGQAVSIDAEDGCVLHLRASPLFGRDTAGGYTGAGAGCSQNVLPEDGTGVQVNGNATVHLADPVITCMTGSGITSTNSANEAVAPTITLTGAVDIENCSSAGIYVTAGTVTVQSGTIQDNFIGIDMEDDGFNVPSVVLNDGSGTIATTITCNSNQENNSTNPGIDVYNNSTGTIHGDWVNWDFWFQPNGDSNSLYWPDYYWCDDSFNCTCESVDSSATSQCMNSNANLDGMNLVLGTGGNATPSGALDLGAQTSTDGNGTGACQ